MAHLSAYDAARADGTGGGEYLRHEGLYSSQITQWRQLRDGGALTGPTGAGGRLPKLTAEQAENARLKRQLEVTNRKLSTTGAALEIMGKVHAWTSCPRERKPTRRSPSVDGRVPRAGRRWCAAPGGGRLAGVSQATAARRSTPAEPAHLPRRSGPAPANKLTQAERAEVLHVLNCDRFVDQPPLQIYPTLLQEGRHLCSVSTMYLVVWASDDRVMPPNTAAGSSKSFRRGSWSRSPTTTR